MTALAYWKAKLALRKKNLTAAKKTVVRRTKYVADAQAKVDLLRNRAKAVNWAVAKTGTSEVPPNSNRGPQIDVWQREFGMIAQPWCGAFAGYALKQGGVAVTNRIVYTPYILQDAKAGRNGFEKLVPLEETLPGDLILMDFVAGGAPVMHVGVARDKYRGNGVIATIEGNTTSINVGDQSNGGGVFKRVRPRSVIVGVARPRWS